MLGFVGYLLNLFMYVIFIGVVLSWLVAFNVVNPHNQFILTVTRAIDQVTEPLFRPIRRRLPDLGGIDLSPMVVILGIIGIVNYLIPAIQQTLLAA